MHYYPQIAWFTLICWAKCSLWSYSRVKLGQIHSPNTLNRFVKKSFKGNKGPGRFKRWWIIMDIKTEYKKKKQNKCIQNSSEILCLRLMCVCVCESKWAWYGLQHVCESVFIIIFFKKKEYQQVKLTSHLDFYMIILYGEQELLTVTHPKHYGTQSLIYKPNKLTVTWVFFLSGSTGLSRTASAAWCFNKFKRGFYPCSPIMHLT